MDLTTRSIFAGLAFQTRDGAIYKIRRVRQADADLLEEFLRRLSNQSRQMRFLSPVPGSHAFVRAEAERMVAGSTGSAMTLVATHERDESEVIAVAELICDCARLTGEVALVVRDDVQCKGIGRFLLHLLLEIAQEWNLTSLEGDAFAENEPVRRLIRTLQLPCTVSVHAGDMHIVVSVPQRISFPLVPEPVSTMQDAQMPAECAL